MALLVPSLSLQFYNLHITLILPISDRKSWSQFIRLMQGYLYYEIHNMFFRKIFFFSLIPNVKCPPWRRQRTLTGWSNLCASVHTQSLTASTTNRIILNHCLMYLVLKSDFDKHHHRDRNTIPHRPSGSFYKSMSQYHKDSSCCKYKANLASPRRLTILHSTLGQASPPLFSIHIPVGIPGQA